MRSRLFSNFALTAAVIALAMPLAAAPAHAGKDTAGLLLGAGLGGLLGNQFGHGTGKVIATSVGVFAGGLVGSSVGRSLDRADHTYYRGQTTSYYAPQRHRAHYRPNYVAPAYHTTQVIYVPQPQPVYVQQGYVSPTSSNGSYCREYTSSVQIGNQLRESYGTACMQPDGSWQIND
ncbi:MAG: glycine zipper 2TM domain-containing protein [Alphaproteobacteria bacterium]|nr:glycine zipper 2TM domain-containing protein [Alphaproteobacteria bacterium]